MHHSSDDDIIHLLNSGSVYFTKINNSDTKLPSFGKSGQIYVRVTFRTGDQECTRVLYLKGQALGSDNKSLGTQKSKISPEASISPVNETSPNERIEQHEEAVPELENVQVPSSEELSKGHIQSKKRKTRNNVTDNTGHRSHFCIQCWKSFSNKEDYMFHFKYNHTGQRSIQCQKCNMFLHIDKFKQHLETHKKVHLETPEKVHLETHKKVHLETHKKVHLETLEKVNLETHKKVHLETDKKVHLEKLFECNQCNMVFTNKDHFILHLADHTRKKLYECSKPYCHRIFSNNDNFMLHMYIHNGKKPYQCSLCDNSFLSNSDLRNHLDMHKGTYSFEIIHQSPGEVSEDKSIIKKHLFLEDKNILEKHLVGQSGYRLHHNKSSDKKILANSDLIDHINVHMEKITYYCNACGKFSLQSSIPEGDIDIKIEENETPCSRCQSGLSKEKSPINLKSIQTLDMDELCNEIGTNEQEISSENSHTDIARWASLGYLT